MIIFRPISQRISTVIRDKVSGNYTGKNTLPSLQINNFLEKIWQLSNVHKAFYHSTEKCTLARLSFPRWKRRSRASRASLIKAVSAKNTCSNFLMSRTRRRRSEVSAGGRGAIRRDLIFQLIEAGCFILVGELWRKTFKPRNPRPRRGVGREGAKCGYAEGRSAAEDS